MQILYPKYYSVVGYHIVGHARPSSEITLVSEINKYILFICFKINDETIGVIPIVSYLKVLVSVFI